MPQVQFLEKVAPREVCVGALEKKHDKSRQLIKQTNFTNKGPYNLSSHVHMGELDP